MKHKLDELKFETDVETVTVTASRREYGGFNTKVGLDVVEGGAGTGVEGEAGAGEAVVAGNGEAVVAGDEVAGVAADVVPPEPGPYSIPNCVR